MLLLLLIAATVDALQPNVAEVQGYTRLRSCKNSTLYQIQASTDYDTNPYLIHLVGSRYGT